MYRINCTYFGDETDGSDAIDIARGTILPTYAHALAVLDGMVALDTEDGHEVVRSGGGRYSARSVAGNVTTVQIARA